MRNTGDDYGVAILNLLLIVAVIVGGSMLISLIFGI